MSTTTSTKPSRLPRPGPGHRGTGHEATLIGAECSWCPDCRAECVVEFVQLDTDPAPIGVCAECGCGMALSPGLSPVMSPGPSPNSVPAQRDRQA